MDISFKVLAAGELLHDLLDLTLLSMQLRRQMKRISLYR